MEKCFSTADVRAHLGNAERVAQHEEDLLETTLDRRLHLHKGSTWPPALQSLAENTKDTHRQQFDIFHFELFQHHGQRLRREAWCPSPTL
jgi:hypothetical protein